MVNSFATITHLFASLRRSLGELSIPGSCILCGEPGEKNLDLCPPCQADLPWLATTCIRCALPLPAGTGEDGLCGQCLVHPPRFEHTLACWHYRPPLAQMVADYKYHRKLSYGRSLALLASEEIVSAYKEGGLPDLVTSVPLHWRRQLWRGFNQSALLADTIASQLGLPFQPLLQRTRPTPAQQSLDADQRRRNLRNAFRCTATFNGERIALVDDVMTTGATANEISRVLHAAGAGEVHIWCLARTPRQGE